MQRRTFLIGSAALVGGAVLSPVARAAVPKPYSWDAAPPTNSREDFIKWMVANRGEEPKYLSQRWSRYQVMVGNKDLWNDANKRAFLLTPREEFMLRQNLGRACGRPRL